MKRLFAALEYLAEPLTRGALWVAFAAGVSWMAIFVVTLAAAEVEPAVGWVIVGVAYTAWFLGSIDEAFKRRTP